MKESLHLVAKGWYRLYYGLMLVVSLLVLLGYFATHYLTGLEHYADQFGLNGVAAILAGSEVAYSLILYWFIKRYNQSVALLICSMLFSLVLLNGLNSTDQAMGSWTYIGIWLTSSLFVGIYGIQLALGSLLVPSIYVLLHYNFQLTQVSQQAWVLVIGNTIIVLATYFFWRSQFIDPEKIRVNQLSGMLRSNQEQSAILIQSISDGVIVTDIEGKIGIINPAAGIMAEWPVNEATGLDVHAVIKLNKESGEDLEATQNPFKLVLESKKRIDQTLQLVGRNGRKQLVSLVVSPIVVPGGGQAGAVAIMHDVSEQRAEEQQRAEFISTASHEMRTPVAAIEGYLALALNEKVSTVDSRARGYLEKAHSSTQHLGQLFQDLLTSAKAEDGRLSNHPTVVELGEFLDQLVEDLRFSAQKKGLITEFVVGNGQSIDATSDGENSKKIVKPLYYVYMDADRMREVVTNLFDNAVKYTDQGKITVGLTGNGEVAQLYIKDTGPGIPAADIPHLFQKFYRVDNSATRTIGGTGLGLFISRKIVELYQGRIWVESELGKGSSFFINLPRLDSQKAQAIQSQTITPVVQPAR